MTKKILSIILICCIVLLAVSVGTYMPRSGENNLSDKYTHSIIVWYTDEDM